MNPVANVDFPFSLYFPAEKPTSNVNQSYYRQTADPDGLGVTYEFSDGHTTVDKFYAYYRRLTPIGRVVICAECWVWTSARRYRAMGKRKVFGLYVRNFWSEILRHRPADREHVDVRT